MTGTGSVDVTVGIDQSCLQVSVAKRLEGHRSGWFWKTAEGEEV